LYEDYQKIKEEKSCAAMEKWTTNLASECETRNQVSVMITEA